MENDSLLDHPVTLSEILDQDSLQRVCMTFAQVHHAGLAVLDTTGQILVDIPAEHMLCRRIGEHPRGTEICGSFDTIIQSVGELGEAPVAEHCHCGLRYEMLAIRHQGAMLGRLVYGPYRPTGMDEFAAEFEEMLGDDEQSGKVLKSGLTDLRRMSAVDPQEARYVVRSIGEVLSVIVQTGYARHLTSQIHIAAIQDAYNELQEKNRRLADSLDKLKELDKLKSNFLATVSHELRTPLTSVIGYSEMLLEGLAGDLNQQQRDYVKTIMDKGDQLLQIISEILDISKIESGAVQLSTERVNVGDLLQQVTDAMKPQARRKTIALNHQVAGDLPLVLADRGKTRQVLLNLFSNAIKFTPEGGAVAASATKAELPLAEGGLMTVPAVEIRVCDTGPGIAEENLTKIFEPFFQVDSSSTRQFGGSGLGLSIVKHFVEAHGGEVWVERAAGSPGSVFIVRMPVAPPKDSTAGVRSRLVG